MKKVLLVDDDKIFVKILRDTLHTKYDVNTANDGEEGLELVESFKPDLIVLDLQMPKVDGMEFMRQLKERNIHIPILVSSQLSDITKISEGIELGIKGYVVKSDYSLDTLVEQIDDVFNEGMELVD
jgi:DNA-binding NarL/FixJ family response regulator